MSFSLANLILFNVGLEIFCKSLPFIFFFYFRDNFVKATVKIVLPVIELESERRAFLFFRGFTNILANFAVTFFTGQDKT